MDSEAKINVPDGDIKTGLGSLVEAIAGYKDDNKIPEDILKKINQIIRISDKFYGRQIFPDLRGLIFEIVKHLDPPLTVLSPQELQKVYPDTGMLEIPKHDPKILAKAKPLDELFKKPYQNSEYKVGPVAFDSLNPRLYIFNPKRPEDIQSNPTHAVLYVPGHNALADGLTTINAGLFQQAQADNPTWRDSLHIEILMPGQGDPLPDGITGENLSLGTTYEPACILQTLRALKANGITEATLYGESAGAQAILNTLALAIAMQNGKILNELPKITHVVLNAPLVLPSAGPMHIVKECTALLDPDEINASLFKRMGKMYGLENLSTELRTQFIANLVSTMGIKVLATMYDKDNSLTVGVAQQHFQAIAALLSPQASKLMNFIVKNLPLSWTSPAVHVHDGIIDPADFIKHIQNLFNN